MVLWVTLLLILAPAAWCFGAQAVGTDSNLFSLDAKGEQLGAVLEQIKEKTGYTVSLDKEWLSAPVNVRFEGQQLGSGLQRVFESVGIRSHAMKIDNEKKSVTVFVVVGEVPRSKGIEKASQNDLSVPGDAEAADNGFPGGIPPEEVAKIVAERNRNRTDVDPYSQPLLPPGEDGQPGMTVGQLREMQEEWARQRKLEDPLDRVVLPPGADGTPALTVRDLKAIRESSNRQNSGIHELDQPILPPGPDGTPAITLRELKAIKAAQAKSRTSIDVMDQIVIPPSEHGGKGITARELRAIRQE